MDLLNNDNSSEATQDVSSHFELVHRIKSSIKDCHQTDSLDSDRSLQVPVQETESCSGGVIMLTHWNIPIKKCTEKTCTTTQDTSGDSVLVMEVEDSTKDHCQADHDDLAFASHLQVSVQETKSSSSDVTVALHSSTSRLSKIVKN